MQQMRLFVAVNFPEKTKQFLGSVIRELRTAPSDARWVREENLHITLQFLGNVPVDQVNSVVSALNRSVAGTESFTLELKGAGVFPSAQRPKVLWVGVSGAADALSRLQQRVQRELAALNFEPEKRRFSPHLTLARVKSPYGFSHVLERAEKLAGDLGGCGRMKVDSIELMQSILKPGGPQYFVLARVPFPVSRQV